VAQVEEEGWRAASRWPAAASRGGGELLRGFTCVNGDGRAVGGKEEVASCFC
jgi:hypothetical protein